MLSVHRLLPGQVAAPQDDGGLQTPVDAHKRHRGAATFVGAARHRGARPGLVGPFEERRQGEAAGSRGFGSVSEREARRGTLSAQGSLKGKTGRVCANSSTATLFTETGFLHGLCGVVSLTFAKLPSITDTGLQGLAQRVRWGAAAHTARTRGGGVIGKHARAAMPAGAVEEGPLGLGNYSGSVA